MLRCSPALMSKLMLSFLVVLLVCFSQALAYKCAGDEFPFGIFPKGDQYVKKGDSLILYCMLNTSHQEAVGYTSAGLSFFRMESERIKINSTILNDTTISAVLEDLPAKEYYIYCSLKLNGGEDEERNCPTYVAVGYEPEIITNFSCVSYNWEELVCRWYPKETNIINTEYTLTYDVMTNRRYDRNKSDSPRSGFSCPKNETIKNMCHLKSPLYRPTYDYYNFRLTGKNPLGSSTSVININNFASVIPNKPESIKVVNQTVGSAFINWTIPHPMNVFPKGLRSIIKYRSKWDPPNQWKEARVSTEKSFKFYVYNITGLEYANTSYDVKIYLQSGAAVSDSYLSEPGTLSFFTPPTIPGRAPKTALGSFHVTSRGGDSHVIVYWNGIPEYMKNGDDFNYNVSCIMNNEKSCDLPTEKTLLYAKYPININNEYRFTIYSVNKLGRSVDSSRVFVPKWGSVPRPEGFTNVPHVNGVHELSWLSVRHENLSNYTIFWCEDEQLLPLPCKGIIDWIDVDRNVSVTNVTMKSMQKFYKFAIAANLKDGSSSGMVWSSCVLHDKDDKMVKEVIVGNVSSREANILWRIECAERSSFGGYYIYYCPALSIQSNECQELGGEQKIFVDEFEKRKITLRKLKPYTTYWVQISIMSYNGTQEKSGPRSKPVRFTTLEDAPSEPLNLRKLLATNSSVTLAWDVPLETNGVLQKYKLDIESQPSLGKRIIAIEAKDSNDSLVTTFVINDLRSYTNYHLALRACTSDIKCSKPSSPVEVMTRAGYPGEMTRPQVKKNNTVAFVEWEPPKTAAGDLNYYELFVSVNGSEDKIKNVTGLRGRVLLTDCNASFKIRAINVDGDKVYKGPWSPETATTCDESASKSTALLVWIACICIFIVILAVLFYIAKRGWLHCRKMKDVEVKLPPGLQSQDLEKDNQEYLNMGIWPPRPNDVMEGALGPGVAPDEPLLVGNKAENDKTPFNIVPKSGGDSSGCSVGRDSMSSSVASDNHASSDSGAEADQCMNASFPDWEPVQTHSNCTLGSNDATKARGYNRKGVVADDPINFSDIDEWNHGDPETPVYTKVGYTDGPNSEKSLPGKGYVTIASITPLSPPQKTINECNYNSLPLDNFPLLYEEEPGGLDSSRTKELPTPQSNPSPCYVTLAYLQERGVDESGIRSSGAVPNSSRAVPKEDKSPNERENESAELPEPAASASVSDKNVSFSKSCAPMPPYVCMIENPKTRRGEDGDEEEGICDVDDGVDGGIDCGGGKGRKEAETVPGEKDKEELREECGRLPSEPVPPGFKTVSGINSGLTSRIGKERESYSNYIPHRIFGQESLHTQ